MEPPENLATDDPFDVALGGGYVFWTKLVGEFCPPPGSVKSVDLTTRVQSTLVSSCDISPVTVVADDTHVYYAEWPSDTVQRILDGDGDTVAVVDMGVDEYVPSVMIPMFVGDMRMQYRDVGGGRYRVLGSIPVRDDANQPVVEASVGAQWILPNGTRLDRQGVTNPQGLGRFGVTTPQTGLYVLCVMDVTKDGWIYDPSLNSDTCEGIFVP
jgi:hypothetical protein